LASAFGAGVDPPEPSPDDEELDEPLSAPEPPELDELSEPEVLAALDDEDELDDEPERLSFL
jgi:hypothetical protein